MNNLVQTKYASGTSTINVKIATRFKLGDACVDTDDDVYVDKDGTGVGDTDGTGVGDKDGTGVGDTDGALL